MMTSFTGAEGDVDEDSGSEVDDRGVVIFVGESLERQRLESGLWG